jgi:hypothetical protein
MSVSARLNHRFFLLPFAVAALALLPLGSHANDQISPRIVGAWVLVSIYEEDSGGEDLDRWGSAPEGQLILRADGSFSFLMVGRNVVRLASTNAEQACARLRACRETMDRKVVGYTGTFSISENAKLSLQITDGLERGWKEARILTEVRLQDNQMHFVTASDPSPTGSFYAHLIWRKSD